MTGRLLARLLGTAHTTREHRGGDLTDTITEGYRWRGRDYVVREEKVPHDPAYWNRCFGSREE